MEGFAKGGNETRQRASGTLRSELYISTQRYGRRHSGVVDLAEVEDEAACEDGRDAKERMDMVSIIRLG